MEFYCEDRFINFPPDVEFQLNGIDAGEYHPSEESPTKVLLKESGQDWVNLSREIDEIVNKAVEPQRYEVQKSSSFTEASFSPPGVSYFADYFADSGYGSSPTPYRPWSDAEVFEDFRSLTPPKGKKGKKPVLPYCVFCKNNGESELTYKSHSVKDSRGHVTCPRLFSYVCPMCNATGKAAHTTKYCPKKPIITLEMTLRR